MRVKNPVKFYVSRNIIDKINTLKTIEIPKDIKISSIVGIYSGMIDSNVTLHLSKAAFLET